VVIIAAIAMFDEVGDWLRANIQNAMQAYLDVPHGEREIRDHQTKKIFDNSNFSESIYDIPQKPELIIKNYGDISTDQAAEMIVERFYEIVGHSKDRGRKAHWDHYYQKSNAPIQPSTYAESVLPLMKSGETMLEIGSGNGRDASYFAKNGMQVIAIDRSEAAVKLCKDQHHNLPIEFYTGTLTDVSSKFGKKKFDAVFTRFVLHAMPLDEEIETLAICSRLMRIGGKLFIECRSINDPLSRKGEILSPTERIDGHYRRFIILEELIERLTNTGFKIQSAKESQGLSAFGNDDPVVIRITAEKFI
jgi:ubiquinone/menaquinone biosynthesis C-methylase UbiE